MSFALYSKAASICFDSQGSTTSSISDSVDNNTIQAIALDDVKEAKELTFLKLDVEGAEGEALVGAEKLIFLRKPLVAICIYHRSDDLWRLPLALHRLMPDHALFLREHGIDGWEMVCYAIPRARLPASFSTGL